MQKVCHEFSVSSYFTLLVIPSAYRHQDAKGSRVRPCVCHSQGSTGTPERRSPRSCLLCFPPFPLPFSPVSPFLPLTLLFSHKHASGNSCVSYLGWDLGLSKVLVRHFLLLVSYVSGFMLYPGRAVRHNVLLFYFTCVCLDVCVCACAPCVCLRSEDSTGSSGTRVTGFMRHCAVLDTEPMSSGRTVRALDH